MYEDWASEAVGVLSLMMSVVPIGAGLIDLFQYFSKSFVEVWQLGVRLAVKT